LINQQVEVVYFPVGTVGDQHDFDFFTQMMMARVEIRLSKRGKGEEAGTIKLSHYL